MYIKSLSGISGIEIAFLFNQEGKIFRKLFLQKES